MAMTVRQFVESLSSSSILSAGELSSIRSSITPDLEGGEAEDFVKKLVQQGKLTKFQALNLYQGRAKGLLFGEYIVLDKLGAGGMGQVFKAQHRRMKRVVALKVLPPHAVSSQKSIQRFYQEVEVAAKLTHPNIVTAYDAGEARGLHYLVMEYVEGQDLSSYVGKHGPLGVEQAVNVVLQAARGLAYAHGLGIVHRDIKPANLLLDAKGVVKILDMGLARIDNPLADASNEQNELTASGEVMGTVDYMSPEQAQDTRTADHRSDIYALGCTLYRLLVGKVPYAGDTTIKKILAHRDQPIPSLRAARPDVPEMLDRVYQKMLTKNVADRTPTMAHVVASLEKLLSGADDEKSSIVVNKEELVHDEPNFNFLQAGPAASNVLPGMSGLRQGAGASSPSGSKSSGVLSATPLPTGEGSGSTPRALPPSVTAAGAGATMPVGGSHVPAGAVFPSLPAAGAAPKIAKAKRLTPGETDPGGKGKPNASSRSAPTDQAASSSNSPSNRKLLLAGAGTAAVVVIGLIAYLLTRISGDAGDEQAAAPAAGASSSIPAAQASAPAPSATAVTMAAVPAPVPSSTSSLPEFPRTGGSTMNFFNAPSLPPPPPGGNSPPDGVPPPPDGGPPTPPPLPKNFVPQPSPPLKAEIDLLATLDPTKRPHHAKWIREGDEIVCEEQNGPYSRVEIPYVAPEEYDLTVAARTSPESANIGIGFMVAGRQVLVCSNTHAAAIDNLDGVSWYDGNNASIYWGALYNRGAETELRLAVRKNRIVLDVGGQTTVDFPFASASRLPAELRGDWGTPPGHMFLYGDKGTHVSKLVIGPPTMKMPAGPVPANLAVAYDKGKHAAEGEHTSARGEILVTGLPGKWSKLSFPFAHGQNYAVRVVVERRTGAEPFYLGLPFSNTRTGIMLDGGQGNYLGVHFLSSGGADVNSTNRKSGMLLLPGTQHVINADVRKDSKGFRVSASVDGRRWIDYAGNDFAQPTEVQVPDPRSLTICTHGASWRIVRVDVSPDGDGRLPVPSSADRSATETALRGMWSSADAKNAPLDGKLLVVDGLRRKAAEELDAPTVRYVALDQALRIAAEAGDLPGAYEAAEDLLTTFVVDAGPLEQRVLDVFKIARPQLAAKQKFTEDVLKFVERASRSERFALAQQMAAALEKFLGTAAGDVRREVRALETENELYQALKKRAADLAAKADGPDADNEGSIAASRGAEGLYLGLALGDWNRGAELLARGDVPAIAAAARLEAGELKTGEQLQAVADKWWAASEEKERSQELKWALAERAAFWYRRAAPLLDAKAKALLDRRKTQLVQLRKASNGAFGPRRPPDAVKIGEHWYKLYPSAVDWNVAERVCGSLGGQLATIESPAENDALTRYLLQAAGGQERGSCWLGISDAEQEGQFRLPDGTPLVPSLYANWQPGQPDNAGGVEDAVSLEATFSGGQFTGQWADQNPRAGLPFICEWDH